MGEDIWDVLVLAGLSLVGGAIWLTMGVAATVAYAGLALVAAGVLGAWWTVRSRRRDTGSRGKR